MHQQFRHDSAEVTTSDATETTLGEVRRANLRGRLYLQPRTDAKRATLHALRSAGLIDVVEPIGMSLGGWFARI